MGGAPLGWKYLPWGELHQLAEYLPWGELAVDVLLAEYLPWGELAVEGFLDYVEEPMVMELGMVCSGCFSNFF